MPVPRKVWLHTSVVMPAPLARRCTIFQALIRWKPRQFRRPTPIGAIFDGLEKRDPPCFAQSRMLDVFGEVALQRVVTGHLMELAALLVEAQPQAALLTEDVRHVQAARCRDAGKGEDHDADQGTVP